MSEEVKKPGLHIHIGGLVILIIIVLILLKVDIKSKIQSEQFQNNISYIKGVAANVWDGAILGPIRSKVGEVFVNFTTDELEKLQNNFKEDVLEIKNTDSVDDFSKDLEE